MSDEQPVHDPELPWRGLCPRCNTRTGGGYSTELRQFEHSTTVSRAHGIGFLVKYEAPVHTCGNCHYAWTDLQKDLAEYRARLEFLELQLTDKIRREIGYTKEEDR
jgi:hypothetical protein